ncbi:gluconate 2-dehydrogenase subunit 3 family protein [Colwellia sp. M166]|uniref:gluconate 2-dehydrogenase subunit 3 family protein n=1 Tax=Colwellia sp. M166 TaxID=2583805 RepID=UPI00211F2F7C|nr:gluconate 2-dehydrogenase subunit 3 family protein [Colwellia sp. M166]UUO23921.1 gluconate 2-dehydrogenase subunit 3 family protein [Colwellia sp. M166]|tara:strand:- start:2570 stop:3340 length:771 start_codon:yes stop_codon:yes gene_type:complete
MSQTQKARAVVRKKRVSKPLSQVLSFFDKNFSTPQWLQKKLSRRNALKSAAGATMVAAMPMRSWSASMSNKLDGALKTDPWLTLDAVLAHLLPESATGPSAQEIQATQYLYNVVFQQPTEEAEIEFIYKGVGWLNGFSNSQLQKNFIALTFDEKENILRAISKSTAGENWLSNLVGYLFEAMLSPPSYGGNPNGIGWHWLEHQAGFPLPQAGKRYYELPGKQPIVLSRTATFAKQTTTQVVSHQQYTRKQVGARKA